MTPNTPQRKPVFNREKHLKYWLRCLKSFLPNGYTGNDANRMVLANFTLCALDLLSALESNTTADERAEYADWIYSCQHPAGGFRAFNGTDFVYFEGEKSPPPPQQQQRPPAEGRGRWDPANIAGTFFALSALAVLRDDFTRVQRKRTLLWLREMQLPDGSFAEVLGAEGPRDGGSDVRFCFLATLIRWILRSDDDDNNDEDSHVPDIDVEALANFMLSSQGYDGGVAKAPFHETHAGWTYCCISALSLLGKLPGTSDVETLSASQRGIRMSQTSLQHLIQWLAYRQTHILSDHSESEEAETTVEISKDQSAEASTNSHHSTQDERGDLTELTWAGFNGRCNKPADTCYSFWVGGSLSVLKKTSLFDHDANRNYLLEKTQHLIGGFGKMPGDPPDILHSYMGLASLAIMGNPGLKSLDPTLCMSSETVTYIRDLPWLKSQKRMQSDSPDD